jgi:sugar phosphate isomerase/epimerase
MESHKIGIATVSLGWHPSHTLERKLDSIAKQGYLGVEIYHPDLVTFAEQSSLTHLQAASKIGTLCRVRGISIIALQPLFDFAGVLTPLVTRLESAREYIRLARAMGTNMIQVPSTFEPMSTGDENVVVEEFRALADLGREESPDSPDSRTISFAYEALAWGIHHALIDDAIRIVKLVDRPNFGLCLDTYHVIARVWAAPHSSSTGTGVAPGGHAALKSTLERFMEQCPVEKIFYLQLSDAERLDQPLIAGHPGYKAEWAHWDATMHWCVWGRLFPFETEYGAYFPLEEILPLWLKDTQWKGWVSMEIFHRDEDKESIGPEVLAERGYKSWLKVKDRFALE